MKNIFFVLRSVLWSGAFFVWAAGGATAYDFEDEGALMAEERPEAVSATPDTEIVGLEAAQASRVARLESRVASLERSVKFLESRLRSLDNSVGDLKRRV